MTSAFIAIDWGTTNRRAYLIADGAVADSLRDDRGILSMNPDGYAAEITWLRSRWGDCLVLIAGMAGSNRGWAEVPYVECPARLGDLAQAVQWIELPRTGIVPGLCQRLGGPDVMCGEEVQIFGAIAAGLAPGDALLCQPGTHSKWVRVCDGAITQFATAMTGELFSLLRQHSLLSAQMQGIVTPGQAFADGLSDAASIGLSTALFRTRSAGLLNMRADRDAAAYASGLLIGAEVAAQIGADASPVHLIADTEFGDLYERAIAQFGGVPIRISSQVAFVAGIIALNDRLP